MRARRRNVTWKESGGKAENERGEASNRVYINKSNLNGNIFLFQSKLDMKSQILEKKMYFKNVSVDKFRLKYILYQSKHYSMQYVRYLAYMLEMNGKKLSQHPKRGLIFQLHTSHKWYVLFVAGAAPCSS